MPLKPRLLYEEPHCTGTETSMKNCNWNNRQLGSGVCDYHPDLGISCSPRHEDTIKHSHYWRGLRFENAKWDSVLALSNTLYLPTSKSKIEYVDVLFGGSGREYNATSALEIEGVPPKMEHMKILHSSYNAINITNPDSPLMIKNCTIRQNRGYGVFINSSYGLAKIDNSLVSDNGADGIKYVHHEERPEEKFDKREYSDFCTIPTTLSQTYPVLIYSEQSKYSSQEKNCQKNFYGRYGQVLTLSFIKIETTRNNSGLIQIFDGVSENDNLLGEFSIRNNTRVQTLTSTRNRLYVKFRSDSHTQTFVYMKLMSAFSKSYDLNVTSTIVSDNNGRGIGIENLKSRTIIAKSSISNNNHVAGLHVSSGVGDVNVTESRIAFNHGDGINITVTGGNRNISRSSISSNKGYGIAIWINNTQETEYIFFNQSSVVQYSEIFKNLETGVLHGNYCGNAYVNVTGNIFTESKISLEFLSCWKAVNETTKLFIGYNRFYSSQKLGK